MRRILAVQSSLALLLMACSKPQPKFGHTLHDYAKKAREAGSREAAVPYAIDEEEGEMVAADSIDQALQLYDWVVGEPIEEKTFGFPTRTNAREPDSIFTVYRFRVEKRFGTTKGPQERNALHIYAMRELPPKSNEVLVLKSGGNLLLDGVLLKKRKSLCFSELMPRRYLLALYMENTGRVGWLALGCRSIFAVDDDLLTPRQTEPEPVTNGLKERFGNSLTALSKALQTR